MSLLNKRVRLTRDQLWIASMTKSNLNGIVPAGSVGVVKCYNNVVHKIVFDKHPPKNEGFVHGISSDEEFPCDYLEEID